MLFIPITVYTWLWYLGWDWWRSSFLVFTLTLVTPFGCLWFFEATEKSGSNGWNTFGNDAEASVWYKVHFGFMNDDIGWKNLTVTSLTSKLKLHHIYCTSGGSVLAGHFLVLAAAFGSFSYLSHRVRNHADTQFLRRNRIVVKNMMILNGSMIEQNIKSEYLLLEIWHASC